MSAHIPFYGELTPEVVDTCFPLQEPDGAAVRIKSSLSDGDLEHAEELFTALRAADGNVVELEARRIAFEERFSPYNLEMLRALRIGIQAGMQIGRQEGANVVNRILSE
jgi:hypothetical protein